jgi:hypothetical protein
MLAVLGSTAPAVRGAFDTNDLAGTWWLHGLISGDSPDQHPGWYWMSLEFDAGGNGSATSVVHDSLGNAHYSPVLERFPLDRFGAVTSVRIDSLKGAMNIGKDLMVATATMAPGAYEDVRGYNLQIFVRSGAMFTVSDLAGTWRLHGVTSGDGPQLVSRAHGTLAAAADGAYTCSIYHDEESTPQAGAGTISLTGDGIFTLAEEPNAHGVMSHDKSLIVFTMSDANDHGALYVMQRRAAATFSRSDLAGVWHLQGLTAGDFPQWTGWLRGQMEVRSTGAFAVSLVLSDGEIDRATDTLEVSPDGVVTLAGVPSAHGVMSDDKNLMVLTLADGEGSHSLILLSRAATTVSSCDYVVGAPAAHGVKTFAWTYGRSGTWTSQITRNVTVPYGDGALTGVEVSNAFEVNGTLWSEVGYDDGTAIHALMLGNFYLSSDEDLSSHPDVWSFATVTDGMLLDMRPYYLIRSDWGEVGEQPNQMLLYHIQDVNVGGQLYHDVLTAWTIDTQYPFVAVDLMGRQADLGLTLPTALATGGYAAAHFRMRAPGVGIIGLGRVDPTTGQLQCLGELQGAVPVGTFAIGGTVYTDANAPAASGLAGVQVTVAGPGGPFTATTDENGVWSLAGLPECTYAVTPSKPGYGFVHMEAGVPDWWDSVEIAANQANAAANQDIQFWTEVHELTAGVMGGHGSVVPSQGTYGSDTVVTLTATPEAGYYVRAWIGTDNDNSRSMVNTVYMWRDRSVTVEFAPAGPNDPGAYLRQGHQEIAASSLSGLTRAYLCFDAARQDGRYVDNRESIFLHALARLTMLVVDTNDVYVETSLLELAELCGIEVIGDRFGSLEVNVPLDEEGRFHLPPNIDPNAVAGMIDDALLPELDSIAAELDTIMESPESPFRMYLEPNDTGLARRVEVDYAEVLALKGLLAGARAALRGLAHPAHDIFVDLYAPPFEGVFGPGFCSVNSLLTQYPELLRVLPTSNSSADGAARLAEAKQDLLAGIDAYFAVVDHIRAETDTQSDDAMYIDPNVEEPLTVWSERLATLKQSLRGDTPGVYPWLTTKTYAIQSAGVPIGQLLITYDATGFNLADGLLEIPNPADPNRHTTVWRMESGEKYNRQLTMHFWYRSAQAWLYGSLLGDLTDQDGSITNARFYYGGAWEGNPVNSVVADLSGLLTDTQVADARLDLNPVFGGTARYPNPVPPRDLLPQFDTNNKPVPGTFGHGLGDDATLGGILPDLTQEDWLPQSYDVWGVDAGVADVWELRGFGSSARAMAAGAVFLGHSDGRSAQFAGAYSYYLVAAIGEVRIDSIQGSDGPDGVTLSGAWSASNGGLNTTGAPDGQFDTVGRLNPLGEIMPSRSYTGGVILMNGGGCSGLTVITDRGGIQYGLTATTAGGQGTVSPASGTYNLGAVVTLTATPERGYYVQAWSGADDDSTGSTVNRATMMGHRTVTVTFAAAEPNDPGGYLTQAFQETATRSLSGLRRAYHYLDLAHQDPHYQDSQYVNVRAALLWHVLARVQMLFIDTENVTVPTSFLELAQLYGITVTGDNFEEINVNVPLDAGGCYQVPAAVDPTTATRALRDSILPELGEIVDDLEAITDGPTPFSARLSGELTGQDGEVEVDYGDVLALRAALYGFRAFLGGAGSYDLFVGPGSPFFCFGDWRDNFRHLKGALETYPDFLKVLPTNGCAVDGAASLLVAKGDLISALEGLLNAVAYMEAETDPQEDDLLSLLGLHGLDLTELQSELDRFRDSLVAGEPNTYPCFTTRTYELHQNGRPVATLSLVLGPGHLWWNQAYLTFTDANLAPAPIWAVPWFEMHGGTLSGNARAFAGDPLSPAAWELCEGYLTAQLSADADQVSEVRLRYFGTEPGEAPVLTGQLLDSDSRLVTYDPNPIFGGIAGHSNPLDPRDLLPQLDAEGRPVAGTFGHGLGDDAELDGLFPSATQEDWLGSGYAVWGLRGEQMQAIMAAATGGHGAFPINYPDLLPMGTKLVETPGAAGEFPGTYPVYLIASRSIFACDALLSLQSDPLSADAAPSAATVPYAGGIPDLAYPQGPTDCPALTGLPDGQTAAVGNLGFLGSYTGFIVLYNPDPNQWTGLKIVTGAPPACHPADTDCDGVIGDFELLDYIDRWVAGEVGDFVLLDAIDLWVAGRYYWDEQEQKWKPGYPSP